MISAAKVHWAQVTSMALFSVIIAGHTASVIADGHCRASNEWVIVQDGNSNAELKEISKDYSYVHDERFHLQQVTPPFSKNFSYKRIKGKTDKSIINDLTKAGKELGLRTFVKSDVIRKSGVIIVRTVWKDEDSQSIDFHVFHNNYEIWLAEFPNSIDSFEPAMASAQSFIEGCLAAIRPKT